MVILRRSFLRPWRSEDSGEKKVRREIHDEREQQQEAEPQTGDNRVRGLGAGEPTGGEVGGAGVLEEAHRHVREYLLALPLRKGMTPLALAPEYEDWLVFALGHGATTMDPPSGAKNVRISSVMKGAIGCISRVRTSSA